MKKLIIMLGLIGILAACAEHNTLVLFVEQEEGVEPYQTRMIVTKEFIRVDDGEGAEDFVLFDRLNKVVFSVNSDEQSVMAIHAKTMIIEPPFELNASIKELENKKDAPQIDGNKTKHYQLLTNKKVCYDVVAVKNLMPGVVKALEEFHTHLAMDSMMTFNNIPADLHNACDMSASTFMPIRHLQFGFPVQEWGKHKYSRSLMDYNENYQVAPKLFMLPQDYKHYSIQDLREGKVDFAE